MIRAKNCPDICFLIVNSTDLVSQIAIKVGQKISDDWPLSKSSEDHSLPV